MARDLTKSLVIGHGSSPGKLFLCQFASHLRRYVLYGQEQGRPDRCHPRVHRMPVRSRFRKALSRRVPLHD